MKFKFCGNCDCPEWLISEITFLSKINAVKLRILTNAIFQAILTNYKNLEQIKKTLEDISFAPSEVSMIIGVLEFILRAAARNDVDDSILNQELQQLGVPQENADSITKVYKNQRIATRKKLSSDIFTFNKTETVDFRVSYILADNYNGFKIKNTDDNIELLLKAKIDMRINFETALQNNSNYEQLLSTTSELGLGSTDNKTYTLDKEMLGKLILDLEKGLEIIQKNQ